MWAVGAQGIRAPGFVAIPSLALVLAGGCVAVYGCPAEGMPVELMPILALTSLRLRPPPTALACNAAIPAPVFPAVPNGACSATSTTGAYLADLGSVVQTLGLPCVPFAGTTIVRVDFAHS